LQKKLTVERVFSDPNLSGPTPIRLRFAPDGELVTYLRPKDEDDQVLDLWAYDISVGEHRCLVRSEELVVLDQVELSEQEKAHRERRRIRQSGIIDYQWAEDGGRLLFQLGGALYVYTPDAPVGERTRCLVEQGEGAFDPKFSPDASTVAFVRDGNLYVADVTAAQVRPLTTDGGGTVQNGVAEFVAQEEMSRYTGYWWSPQGTHIAYTQIDEAEVPLVQRPSYHADRVEVIEQRYPAAGQNNAKVRVGIVDLQSGQTVWAETDPEQDHYIARVDWLPGGDSVAIQTQTRDQRQLRILRADVASGLCAVLLTESDEHWVELHDDLRFLKSGDRFVWASERTGFNHLYLCDIESGEQTSITSGEWPVGKVCGIDEAEGAVYWQGWTKSPLEQHLYRTSLTGGESTQVTIEAGWHQITMSSDCAHWIDVHSDVLHPPQVTLRSIDGEQAVVLEENVLPERDEYAWVAPEFVTLEAEDGTPLYARLTRPLDFDASRTYPAVVKVYGGPHSQTVLNAWDASLRAQLFAHAGFVVLELDNRGMGNRGKAFGTALHLHMGGVEVRDQVVGAAFLRSLDYVDGERIGVFGWSYGGYMTLMCMMQEPDVFQAGVSVAPVTDWRLYDTHYTERYMGHPEANEQGYADSSVMTYADQLRGKLLLVHGMADDNVLFQNSVLLMDALQKASIPFEMMAYPGKRHGIAGKPVRIHLFEMILAHFKRYLA